MQSDINAEEDIFAGDALRPVEIISLIYFVHLNTNDDESLLKALRELNKCLSSKWGHFAGKMSFEKNVTTHVAGSFSEGSFSDSFESDLDFIHIPKHIACCDYALQDFENAFYDADLKPKVGIEKKYIAEKTNASPGYVLLIKLTKYFEALENPGIGVKDAPLDNSWNFHNVPIIPPFVSVSGPALHAHLRKIMDFFVSDLSNRIFFNDDMKRVSKIKPCPEIDLVLAIPYYSNSLETSWMQRKRMHGWPSPALIQEITQLHGHVVPVGMRGSRLEHYEWRICYTLLEIKLVCSLNEVQMILYIELKKYAKLSGCLTSYMVKNIVFWMAECLPSFYFEKKYFIPLVRSTLLVLRKCVERKSLPNYMIPSRNLFAGKLDDETERQNLIDFLSSSSGKDYTVPVTFQKLQCMLHTYRSGNTKELSNTGGNIGKDFTIREGVFPGLELFLKGNKQSKMIAFCKNLLLKIK